MVVLSILFLFLLSYFDLRYILLNTTPTGGDTPAHNYLVKHLKESFFGRGAVISWAKGWWCGFPMYQYYFFFPYFVMALLSFFIPMNIAFKIVSISGVLLLPLGVYFSLKWMKFEFPIPILGSIAMLPFLFVHTHTMWGVNIYSTLAGEISNSISFVFFVLFLGSFYKDMEETQFRLRTVVLFTLLFYTHFFTSVIAGAVSFFLLFLFGQDQPKERAMVYLKTNLLTFLLAAWWLVPLLAKGIYSMEFGGDWDVALWKTFPLYTAGLIPPMLFALIKGLENKKTNIIFFLIMLLISIFAFYTGGKINASFTNIRFWPFIFYALIIMASAGLGYLLEEFKAKELFIAALLVSILMALAVSKNNVRAWVKWNYEGLEQKSDYSTFRDLIYPLNNTPGRLANDLCEYNNHFGSSRVFETVPYLINKDILEGGIVNSATGSMFSYYIQGETSKNSAGFPTVVKPAAFNLENGTKHLELANVKHFIAYWEKTRKALLKHPKWKLLRTAGPYQLFELTSNNGNYIYIPQNKPAAVRTKHWKESAMQWIYTIQAINNPFILSYRKTSALPEGVPEISEEEYLTCLLRFRKFGGAPASSKAFPPSSLKELEISDQKIHFKTKALHLPHIIKMSYFPNWKVKGARRVFHVTPNFMLVYPEQEEVTLYYGPLPVDILGCSLTLLGMIAFAGIMASRIKK